MQKYFDYGHKIIPQESEDESDSNLQNLFKIGKQKIKITTKKEENISDDDDSDQTVKNKTIKKQKKQKKSHKQKKQKKHKEGKQKKQKKKHKRSKSKESNKQIQQGRIQLFTKTKQLASYEKYKHIVQKKSVDQIFAQKFQLNIKLGEGLLQIDIISFPEHRLYQYGPLDKQIPRYQRIPNHYNIIGFKKSKQKKARKIIRQLNKIINQKNIDPNIDEKSKDRYFDYKGYESTGFQKLAVQKKMFDNDILVKFNIEQNTSASQQDHFLKITKQFNRKINQNPNDIDTWLQFIGIQDNLSVSLGSMKNKTAVLDRKISILQKSLTFNPNNQRIGVLYLSLLFDKQYDFRQIIKKCQQFILVNPSSINLWKLYFNLSIKQFSQFSHPFIRKIFQQINHLFKKVIEKTKSAIQIWKIRKASLQILRNIIFIYKLQGYTELATGIIVALIEYNIFMPQNVIAINQPQQKQQQFAKYWDDFSKFKLGQTDRNSSWSNQIKIQNKQNIDFIRNLQKDIDNKSKNAILDQMKNTSKCWRTSNGMLDQTYIQANPESFILYQDLDFTLMLYRDNESIVILIDILADHLQLPPVFSIATIQHQFTYRKCQTQLKRQFLNKSQRLRSYSKQSFAFWDRFWNPQETQFIMKQTSYVKIQYFRRILQTIKQKMPIHKSIINEYLCFIACTVYLSPKIQKYLQINQQKALQWISDILYQEPLNLSVWAMYIQIRFIRKNNRQQCLNCFQQLFDKVKEIDNKQDRKNKNCQILYWLYSFCKNHEIDKNQYLLNSYKNIILDQNITADVNVFSRFDCLLLEKSFKETLSVLIDEQRPKLNGKQSLINVYKSIIFLFLYLDEYPTSSLIQIKDIITKFLINELLNTSISTIQFFILQILIDNKLLTRQQIYRYDLLKKTPYMILVKQWVRLYSKPIIMFISQFQSLKNKSLVLWMVSSLFLCEKGINNDHFYQYFCGYGKDICFQDKLNDQHPQYIALLNELLIYDVNQKHNKFHMFSLNNLPFSKNLYLLNLLSADNSVQKQKMITLIHEKSIRIMNQNILHQ